MLQSSLYPKWIEAISIENNLECRSKMSQLLSELPTSNLLLLRHFLCTLWYIAQRSPINKMCSVNLGVCVGQSMLTPHPIGSPNIQLPSTQRCEVSYSIFNSTFNSTFNLKIHLHFHYHFYPLQTHINSSLNPIFNSILIPIFLINFQLNFKLNSFTLTIR